MSVGASFRSGLCVTAVYRQHATSFPEKKTQFLGVPQFMLCFPLWQQLGDVASETFFLNLVRVAIVVLLSSQIAPETPGNCSALGLHCFS